MKCCEPLVELALEPLHVQLTLEALYVQNWHGTLCMFSMCLDPLYVQLAWDALYVQCVIVETHG